MPANHEKQNIICLVVGVLVLLIMGGFYWYEWRPTQIKKECSRISQSTADIFDKPQGDKFVQGSIAIKYASPDERYKTCLRSKGL